MKAAAAKAEALAAAAAGAATAQGGDAGTAGGGAATAEDTGKPTKTGPNPFSLTNFDYDVPQGRATVDGNGDGDGDAQVFERQVYFEGKKRYAPIHSRLQVRAQRDTRKVHTVFTHWNYMMQRSRRLPNRTTRYHLAFSRCTLC